MSSIPDTGPELSGFLGRYLWYIYIYFPSQGHWDWVLLYLALGILVHFTFLPSLWRTVKADINLLQVGKSKIENQSIATGLWALAWLLFFVWFFSTRAGQTFLTGRSFFSIGLLARSNTWLLIASALLTTVEIVVMANTEGKIYERNRDMRLTKPQAYHQRNWQNLYAGGGVFMKFDNQERAVVNMPTGIVTIEVALFWLAHLLFPIWSVAALVLLHTFIISAFLADGCRMLFVYIQHKKTFGIKAVR